MLAHIHVVCFFSSYAIALGLEVSRLFFRMPVRLAVMLGFAHGVMLLLGTVAVSLGFAAGLMYLVQSWRLKHHVSPSSGLKLPSLEWLQAINKQSLVYSSCFIAMGLIAGIVLNAVEARGS